MGERVRDMGLVGNGQVGIEVRRIPGADIDGAASLGCLGVGDPASDVMAAWTLLSADTRDVFHAALSVDDATWARGRGWALSTAVIAVPYYHITNPVLARIGRRAIDEVLTDHSRGAQHSG